MSEHSELISCADHLSPIAFSHVPQITKRAVPELIVRLSRRQRVLKSASTTSFGALVIREGGEELAQRILKRLPGGGTMDTAEFKGQLTELHSDRAVSSQRNGVTAHVTLQGSVEAAVLIAPLTHDYSGAVHFVEQPEGVLHEAKEITTERLFNESTLCLDAVQLAAKPVRALRTILNEGDILLFDDTQLHAMQSAGDAERFSRAYFILPSEPTPG